ncbi:MAG: GrpB family protein [bacterium]|nr:GrpB family protein [bacterium]
MLKNIHQILKNALKNRLIRFKIKLIKTNKAAVELNKLSTKESGQLFPIIISEYNPNWPQLFISEKAQIENILGSDNIVRIEHIGSTAVPNIKAKPTIDILLEIEKNVNTDNLINRLKMLGYIYVHQPTNPAQHMMFTKGYTEKGFAGQAYHVHIRYSGDWDELYFRDYLIKNPKIGSEYVKLKLKLAQTFKNDREAYTDAKTKFIEKIVKQERKNQSA